MGRLLRQVVKKFEQLESRNRRSEDTHFPSQYELQPHSFQHAYTTETLIPPEHFQVYRHNYALPEVDGRTRIRKISVYLQSAKIQKTTT